MAVFFGSKVFVVGKYPIATQAFFCVSCIKDVRKVALCLLCFTKKIQQITAIKLTFIYLINSSCQSKSLSFNVSRTPFQEQNIKSIDINPTYHQFLGLSLNDRLPHFTTSSKNYIRCFQDKVQIEEIFIIFYLLYGGEA